MKRLQFDYSMKINYTEQVDRCHYTIKCIPQDTERQRLEEVHVFVAAGSSEPGAAESVLLETDFAGIDAGNAVGQESVSGEKVLPEPGFGKTVFEKWEASAGRGTDSFGNRFFFGSVDKSHDSFLFRITGIVTAGLADCETLEKEGILGAYRYPYGLTVPGEGLRSYFADLNLQSEQSDYEKCVQLMHRVYNDFTYEKGVTDVGTSAEEAWQLGKGVCQDYAHIMIVLCRMAGIPARYAAGMLMGEGFSHAWVEVFCQDKWYALDPTNNLIVADSHIKLGVGRDASDCTINRGVIRGGGSQTQIVKVIVQEAGQQT